ncbi:MAG: hypothetical protein ABSB00_03700 [Minisyncoccia bacterium]|jgi:hypothetical protein
MKTIFEHIKNAKEKPHHIRKRIAFAATTGITALIALVWLVGSFSSGAFAIRGSTFAESTESSPVITTTENQNQNIAGAAAALPSANTPAHIEIITTAASTSESNKAEQTTIPF